MQTATYGSPSFAVSIKTPIPKASRIVNRYLLPIIPQPHKITGILGKAIPLISRRAGC